MPKENNGKIRFIMFEMEGGSDQLAQGMQAIVSALRQPATVVRSVTPAQPALTGNGTPAALEESVQYAEEEPIVVPVAKKPANTKRSYYSPKVLDDLDLITGDMPFEAFCKHKNPQSTNKKYLVIADWLKEKRGITAIGQDHIYTCYRKMAWGGMKDYGQPFRDAAKSGYGTVTNGTFAINHIGKDVVDKMTSGS